MAPFAPRMTTWAVAFLHLLFTHQTGGAEDGQGQDVILGELGTNALLPCRDLPANVTPSVTRWLKDGSVAVTRNYSSSPRSPDLSHFYVHDNGSLSILRLQTIDEATYSCECATQEHGVHAGADLRLLVVSGPTDVIMEIRPTSKHENGTLFVHNGSVVVFRCLSQSYPSLNLTWTLDGDTPNKTPVSTNGSLIQFELNVEPSFQGNHSCTAENPLSKRRVSRSMELLVYYAPERHPECSWSAANDSSFVLFTCSWYGAYPSPVLEWLDDKSAVGGSRSAIERAEGESLEVMLNRSRLTDHQTVLCKASHVALNEGEEKFCSFELKSPYPEGEPMVTALEGSTVTLTCTEGSSIPLAKTTWTRTVKQEDITPSGKYVMSDEGPVFRLTIVNVTKQDEGIYFCRSENPLGVREMEVYLTVKDSASNTGGIVGTFIAVLILGAGFAIGIAIYSNRDRICFDPRFSLMSEERSDVLSLVDSDEEIFSERVPRLPAMTNGHSTTLVEIHRIPSSDHEDQLNKGESQEHEQEHHDVILEAE
ncbi:V-set and immunoglobulin domain-containing protein 10 [Denticeps clupeoides]|uniref:Ig-like domain-containing protein n=1 Tax=Denticeps clupeoides TaxID=299321 RepID=A0AAY4C6E1_9TELE|nr:V-set and immunoglobulin domain-containing protein 10 [Denticeps clupeoides]